LGGGGGRSLFLILGWGSPSRSGMGGVLGVLGGGLLVCWSGWGLVFSWFLVYLGWLAEGG